MSLSPEQQNIVAHDPKRHARVLAGPGTGKSFTSVAYLENLAAKQADLKVRYITFTRAATDEFVQKLGASDSLEASAVSPQTVHGFALSLLLRHQSNRIPYPLRIPDTWEVKNLIWPQISRMLKGKGFGDATPSTVGKLELEMSAGFASLDPSIILFSKLDPAMRNAYLGIWKEHRVILGYSLLGELPFQAAEVVREKDQSEIEIDLIIADEYQDLNKADISLLQNLSERGVAIMAIGDDDQSIYGWRMAAPDGIRNFLGEYGSALDYTLTDCRRCGDDALAIAQAVIETEPSRPQKKRLRNSSGKLTSAKYLRFKTDYEEAAGVAALVEKYLAKGIAPEKIVILARSSLGDWLKELKPHFDKIGVSLKAGSMVGEALEDKGLRMRLALAHLLCDRTDSLAWMTILDITPSVGPQLIDFVYSKCTGQTFGQTLLDLVEGSDDTKVSGKTQAWAAVQRALAAIEELAEKLQADEINYGEFVRDLPGDALGEEAKELFDLHIAENGAKSLSGFLSTFEPVGKDLASAKVSGVRMMSIAQSKGITVDVAIMIGVEDGIVPLPAGDPREELRLLYVGMTRAERATIMTWASIRRGMTARHGASNVGQQRSACTFLDHILRWEDGAKFIQTL